MTEELYAANRDAWRAWLEENHNVKRKIWLIYYKKHTGKRSIPYEDSVEEALCYGWVDSIIKKIDDDKCARKFTPRKACSRWSESNKRRAYKMMKEGKMTEEGLARVREAMVNGKWSKASVSRRDLTIPSYFLDALAKNKKALKNFDRLAPSYKRQYVEWILGAKKEETRQKRIAEVADVLGKGKKLGLK